MAFSGTQICSYQHNKNKRHNMSKQKKSIFDKTKQWRNYKPKTNDDGILRNQEGGRHLFISKSLKRLKKRCSLYYMTVHDELFEIQCRIAKHELKKFQVIKKSRTKQIEILKENTTLTEEDTKHLDEEMDFLDEHRRKSSNRMR